MSTEATTGMFDDVLTVNEQLAALAAAARVKLQGQLARLDELIIELAGPPAGRNGARRARVTRTRQARLPAPARVSRTTTRGEIGDEHLERTTAGSIPPEPAPVAPAGVVTLRVKHLAASDVRQRQVHAAVANLAARGGWFGWAELRDELGRAVPDRTFGRLLLTRELNRLTKSGSIRCVKPATTGPGGAGKWAGGADGETRTAEAAPAPDETPELSTKRNAQIREAIRAVMLRLERFGADDVLAELKGTRGSLAWTRAHVMPEIRQATDARILTCYVQPWSRRQGVWGRASESAAVRKLVTRPRSAHASEPINPSRIRAAPDTPSEVDHLQTGRRGARVRAEEHAEEDGD